MIGMRASKASLESGAGRPVGRAMRRMGWLAGAALCALAVPGHAQDAPADDPAQNEEAERNYGEVIVFIAQNRHLASIAARDPTVRFILALSYYRLGDEIATGRYLDWDPGKTTEEELKILQEF